MNIERASTSPSRRYVRYGLYGILLVEFAIVAARTIIPNWGRIAPGSRPMFTEWRPGDRGWGWRRNWVWDTHSNLYLFDPELNSAVLVIAGREDCCLVGVKA